MNISSLKTLGKLQKIEIAVLVVFVLFIVFPIPVPALLSPWIDTPLAVALLLLIDAFLFFKIHPFIGILFLFVIYELIRRAAKTSHRKIPMIDYTRSERKRDAELAPAPSTAGLSLEEETVLQSGVYDTNPRGGGFYETSFQPVYDNAHNASIV